MEETMGIISTSETLFSPFNLFIIGALFIILPVTNRLMMNKDETYQIDLSLLDASVEAATLAEADTPAEKLENSSLAVLS
jgi:short-chain fatty acids transporter